MDVKRGIMVAVDAVCGFRVHLKTRPKRIRATKEISQNGKYLHNDLEAVDGLDLDGDCASAHLDVKSPKLRKPRDSQLNEKMARKVLWMDGCSIPVWVKARLTVVMQGRRQSRSLHGSRYLSQDAAQENGMRHMYSADTTKEAIAALKDSLQQGITSDSYTYIKVLQLCLKEKDLSVAKQVHECIIESGMDKNTYVANALLNVYIRCGGLLDAHRVFDKLEAKDVITWNTMISGFAKSNHAESAMKLFNQMRQAGAQPDEVTFLSILKACAGPSALKWGKEVHACIAQCGFESDVRVGTALLQMYAKCGSITEARRVFENLTNRNIITWNVMIGACAECGLGDEAYQLFLQMRREGFEPDAITYINILNANASVGALDWVKEVHSHAMRAGLESDLRVANALIHMYAKSGSIDDARLVFSRMEKRDKVTWTTMIGGLTQHGCGQEAYGLFLQMCRNGFEADAFTYASILNASVSEMPLEWVKEVQAHARKAGLESDLRVGSALVHIYAKHGCIEEARLVFDKMDKRDVVTWTQMIGGLAQHGFGYEAYKLLLQMKQEDLEPNAFTYSSILNASASEMPVEWVKDVHLHARKAGLDSDLRVGNALLHMYAKSGAIDDARLVFDKMEKRDVVTWNTMIGGLAQHGYGHEAVALFRTMNGYRVKPNGISFAAVLSACCHAGLLEDGHRLFVAMVQDYGVEPDLVHYNCMVDLLGRAGLMEEARLFIGDMPLEPNEVSWKTLLGACRTHSNVELGELAAKELLKLEPNDPSTYVLLYNIYAAAGELEKASSVRTIMQMRGIRKEPGRSWIELDQKIHEFVVGDTSHPEATAIHSSMNKLTDSLKVEGYIPNNARRVLQNLQEDNKERSACFHSEKLAIAYGLMRLPAGQPIRVYKNLRVCPDCHTFTKYISKVTGREIIARDANRFHHFKDGSCSCGDYW